ncbi:MAG: alpha/beta fold hydrolase [Pelagimonas sp.]|uniref:alpha/beta fold hydrolase n=1 Tax=Pelagimonas sp. TaxID=2073170 RepID=UPI003D6C18DA
MTARQSKKTCPSQLMPSLNADLTGKVTCISPVGFHEIAYREFGRYPAKNNVLCVHGLTRNSHDFDYLASQLSAEGNRVVCADLVGRGQSDWLSDPQHYQLLQYNSDIVTLAAERGLAHFDWIGTSLGGLMGISLAGLENSPIKRLIVNDIGPKVPYSALSRVTLYAGTIHQFSNLDDVEAHLRETLTPFGPMTDDNWHRMAVTSAIETDVGFELRHDPNILQNFRRYFMFMHFSLWNYWERITCPVLVLRGTQSDFLTETLANEMLHRLPHAELIEFEGVGHTPTLNADWQIDPILRWLDANP